jgi:hypothetical protein
VYTPPDLSDGILFLPEFGAQKKQAASFGHSSRRRSG